METAAEAASQLQLQPYKKALAMHKAKQGISIAQWLVWLLATSCLPPCAKAANQTIHPQQLQQTPPTRFFIDEGYFLDGDTEILRAYIAASNSRIEISGESTAAFLSIKGYYVPEKWDVYWTIRQSCHMAFPYMRAGQMINCIPGVQAMSLKRRFIQTWQQAYGESAFSHIPRSYLLPEQYWLWRSYLVASGSGPASKWVLKANVHRGKGVAVVEQTQALSQALLHTSSSSSSSSSSSDGVQYHNVLIQQYCEPQMIIAGRSSYIRVWLLVTSLTPLRAYLFKGGFAIFGKQKGLVPAAAAAANETAAGSSISTDDWIVNLWIQDRDKSPIWSLSQLEEYLNKHPEQVLPLPADNSGRGGHGGISNTTRQQQGQRRTFDDAWTDIQTSASLVLAAALPSMRAAAANSSAPGEGMFEYFGLDFVFDAHLRPWMLEVNAVPSMARRKRSGCTGGKATDNCQLNTVKAHAAAGAGAVSGNTNSSSSSSSGNGAAAAAAAAREPDDFDTQKEQFVHDMLVLLGMPVNAPSAAAAANSLGSSSKGSAAPQAGLSLLQRAAAAATAAAIPPTNTTTTSSSSSSVSTGRRLSHRRLSLRQQRRQQQQQQQQQQRDLPMISIRSTNRLVQETPGHTDSANLRLLLQERRHRKHRTHRHHHRPSPAAVTAAAAAAVTHTASSHAQPVSPVVSVQDLPKSVQALLCPSSSSGRQNLQQFACTSCLTAADLAAVAAAEAELQRAGRFLPVYDLINAHRLNSLAAGHRGPPPASQAAAGGGAAGGGGGAAGAGVDSAGAASMPAGSEYLSSDRSVWQKLYDTWKGMSSQGVGLKDLGIMKYYTTESELAAARKLALNMQDYVMSAWLRIRQQQQKEGGCLTGSTGAGNLNEDCVIQMLQQLVKQCYTS